MFSQLLLKNVSNLFLSGRYLNDAKNYALQVALPIRDALEEYGHKVEIILTGSIVEQYGQPSSARCLKSNLRTDYDIMFLINHQNLEYLVHNEAESVFLTISSPTRPCNLIKCLVDSNEDKLNAETTRRFMMKTAEEKWQSKENISKFRTVISFLMNVPRLTRYKL